MRARQPTTYDVVVIGGGPAGMMTAGRAAERGAKVLLLEKNPKLGKKLLITGGGRCNITNAEHNTRTLLSHFKSSDKFLFSAFSQWNVKDTLDYFHQRGLETKIENNNRVFPVTDSAQSVYDVLVHELVKHKVTLQTNRTVTGFSVQNGTIACITLDNHHIIKAHAYVLATGGKSRPETGSTGDGFTWLRDLGHTISEPDPSLVPIAIKDTWVHRLAGITLPDVKINVYQNKVRQNTRRGRLLFTHVGVTGPTILNLSKDIGELLKYGEVVITLDLFPTLENGVLDRLLVDAFHKASNKQFKNVLADLLPSALATAIAERSGIDGTTPCHSVAREVRHALGHLLKHLPLNVKGLLGVDKAIVTSGGVALEEINFKTMQSRKYENLYVVGDLLNIDRPSGGYSLQLCWTTGFVAGNAVPIFRQN